LSSLCLQRQITDFHVLIQRLHFKPQQVQLQTGFSRTFRLFPTIQILVIIIFIIIIIKIETTLQPEAELRGLHIITCTTYKYIINTIL
jgi:hypothetical protein